MKSVTIYSTINCPYCIAAKNLCISKGLDYKEIDLTNNPDELNRIKNQTGMMTVPQIFIGEEFVGGYVDLKKLSDIGELEKKMLKD